MKCFIAVLIRMSIVKNSSIRDYWKDELQLKYVNSVLPRDRFLFLLKYFHFTNNRDETSSESRTSKISPILKGFDQFSKAVLPSYNISIDESIVPFKGRSGMKIIIKGKPNPEGHRKQII